MKIKTNIIVIMPVLFLIYITPAQANKDALARAQYMIRQINAELNQLKSSNQKIKSDMKSLESEHKSLKKKYAKLEKKSNKNKNVLSGRVVEVKQAYSDEINFHNETRKRLQRVESDNKRLADIGSENQQRLNMCIGNNHKLYDVNIEILAKYENKGVWDSLSQAEPFSNLTQVEIENLVDDYQYHMDDLRVQAQM